MPATYLRYSSECKKFGICHLGSTYYMAVMAMFCMAYLILTITGMIIPVLNRNYLAQGPTIRDRAKIWTRLPWMAPEQTLCQYTFIESTNKLVYNHIFQNENWCQRHQSRFRIPYIDILRKTEVKLKWNPYTVSFNTSHLRAVSLRKWGNFLMSFQCWNVL